ncbi:MAG: ArnT family glycosyltransferase [Anaerolineae bacterium]
MSNTNIDGSQQSRRVRLATLLAIGSVLLFHTLNNWRWLAVNVTSTGWDKPRHLARSLNYARMLEPVTIQSLFGVMISDPVRPPLFPASATIAYRLFGWNADVATMINILYMAIALAATYGLGRHWGSATKGHRLGLVSVLVLGSFPMFYAMSRYFYLEFALMAMVTLTLFLLLATEGFQRRGLSILFGLSLGLGLLTKRTFAVFVVGPIGVVILGSGLLPLLWRRLRQRPRIYWKTALVALIGGLVLVALWYLPNRQAVRGLVLGDALFFIWWILAALTIYFVGLPSARLSNALSAVFLAASLASTWYLARIEFLERVALYGYGVDDPRGRTLRLDNINTYLYYIRKLGNEHTSFPIFVLLLIVVVVAGIVTWRRRGSLGRLVRQIRLDGWAVLAWVGGAYALFTFSIYQETRAFTPALPAIALIFAAALFALPWRRIRWAVLTLVLVFGLVQFFVLSYEPVQQWLAPQTFALPGWGRTSSFAQGVYIQLPDEGQTDRGYWIEPDVLRRMEQHRLETGKDLHSLGMLVNTTQINAGPFNYLILTEYPELRVESLIARFDETSPYRRLFGHDYVAVKRDNAGANPAQQQVIDNILDDPPELFARAFELETTYHLPDGDTVSLYRQRHPLPADYPAEYITHLAAQMGQQASEGDAILLTPPQLVYTFLSEYTGTAEVYLAPETEGELEDITASHQRIFLVIGDPAAGEAQALSQEWLNRHAFFARHQWADSLQVLTYGTVEGQPATTPNQEISAVLGDQIELLGIDLPATNWQAGQIVPLSLFWQRLEEIDSDYGVFVHLVDGAGQLVAQTDSPPVGGSLPTSSWQQDEIIVDRHGLPLPAELGPGHYELRVGMVDPSTGDRLPVVDRQGQRLDSVVAGTLEID